MRFEVEAQSGEARAGRFWTDRGVVETPIFMPVGTVGSVKGVPPRDLIDEIGAPLILANTYHLYLRPGTDTLEQFGGLHPFMSWDGPILTDSGGYQVFSLAANRRLDEDGVTFKSHLDGSSHLFTPESVIDIQRAIGSDIVMVLDECPPADVPADYARNSLDLTLRWASRCRRRFDETEARYGPRQFLFGIAQGVVDAGLRREAASRLVEIGFDGYAIGGLSVGEEAPVMYEMVEACNTVLPTDAPRYLMGVGTPENLIECVARGIDMFDCVMPTRNGRNGMVFTTEGVMNIRNEKWVTSEDPIDGGLDAYVSSTFSRGYLRHLFQSGELLGLYIASVQNLSLYLWLMREARRAICEGRFEAWRGEILPKVTRRL
ncbi:MAG: tRNA guanosine(34) transglycosylase Tgt [Rhodothermales bacterium]